MTQHELPGSTYPCVMPDASSAIAFGTLIGDARRAKGWSQDDLEAASGVSRSTISRWERGVSDSPEPPHVRAVCAALGIDPRRAAIALGFLTEDEVSGTAARLDPEVEGAMRMLESDSISPAERQGWIDYLKFLYAKGQRGNGPRRAS